MPQKPTILICDDDIGVLEGFRMLLKDQGYELLFEKGVCPYLRAKQLSKPQENCYY